MCALFARILSLLSPMKAGGGTGTFRKSIAGLLFGVVRTALGGSTHIASMTCEAMCGPSIGICSPYILQRHPWRGWIGGRRERRGGITWILTQAETGLGELRSGAALPKEEHHPGRSLRRTPALLHLPWAPWERAPGFLSARNPQSQDHRRGHQEGQGLLLLHQNHRRRSWSPAGRSLLSYHPSTRFWRRLRTFSARHPHS